MYEGGKFNEIFTLGTVNSGIKILKAIKGIKRIEKSVERSQKAKVNRFVKYNFVKSKISRQIRLLEQNKMSLLFCGWKNYGRSDLDFNKNKTFPIKRLRKKCFLRRCS